MQSISNLQSTTMLETTQARAGGWVSEVFLEYAVERRKIAGIIEPDAAAHHVFRVVAGLVQNRQQILNGLMTLRGDVAFDDGAVHHRDLAGNIEPAVRFDGPCKGQMLTADPFAAFYSVALHWNISLRKSIV